MQVLRKGTLQVWHEMRAASHHPGWRCREQQAILAATAVRTSSRRLWTAATWPTLDAGAGAETERRDAAGGYVALPICLRQERQRGTAVRLYICVAQVWLVATEQ
jgi:hypothetical protein